MREWKKPKAGIQRDPRVRAALDVRISTVEPEIDIRTGNPFFRSAEETTVDFSRGGIRVHSWEPLAAGTRVIIEVEEPGGGTLQLLAIIAWTRRELRPNQGGALEQPGYGISFSKASKTDLARLDRILESLAETSHRSGRELMKLSPRPSRSPRSPTASSPTSLT